MHVDRERPIPKELWTNAVMISVVIHNRCFNKRLRLTPYYLLTGMKPDLSKMKESVSVCYAYRQNKRKLDPRSIRASLWYMITAQHSLYLIYFPDTGNICKHRLVIVITINMTYVRSLMQM